MRRWQLAANQLPRLTLAADARLSHTNGAVDHVWSVALGMAEQPALTVSTTYGERAQFAAITPMWFIEGRAVYETGAYAQPPVFAAFAPAYARLEANLTRALVLSAEYHVPASDTLTAVFSVHNEGETPISVRLDLMPLLIQGSQERSVKRIIVTTDGETALTFGSLRAASPHYPTLYPLVRLGSGKSIPESAARIGATQIIPAGETAIFQWVSIAKTSIEDSMDAAEAELAALNAWEERRAAIERAANALPIIETSDLLADTALAVSLHHTLQAFVRPAYPRPYPAVNPQRAARMRSSFTADYLAALAVASSAPELAWGVVENALTVQQPDGSIIRDGMFPPLLARLTWGIFQATEDEAKLHTALPKLIRFFEVWLRGDELPTWQDERQMGYSFFPTFSLLVDEGQGVETRAVHSPDLIAYLLSEAVSLREIAYYLRDEAAQARLQPALERLNAALERLWNGTRYTYRDRETWSEQTLIPLLTDGRADELHPIAFEFEHPQRLLILIKGAFGGRPSFRLQLQGAGANGQAREEHLTIERFASTNAYAVATSTHTYQRVDLVRCEGLIGTYRITLRTVDHTRLDTNALLPLFAVAIPPERAAATADLAFSAAFLGANGIGMVSKADPSWTPEVVGAVYPFWNTLIGEGLIEAGITERAADLAQRLFKAGVGIWRENGAFGYAYPTEGFKLSHPNDDVGGLLPLHLLMRVWGVRVLNARSVWTGGAFHWEMPITITQHGVTITRSTAGTDIVFPSGHAVTLPSDAPFQWVTDTSADDA